VTKPEKLERRKLTKWEFQCLRAKPDSIVIVEEAATCEINVGKGEIHYPPHPVVFNGRIIIRSWSSYRIERYKPGGCLGIMGQWLDAKPLEDMALDEIDAPTVTKKGVVLSVAYVHADSRESRRFTFLDAQWDAEFDCTEEPIE
jgi:hypothetical protein